MNPREEYEKQRDQASKLKEIVEEAFDVKAEIKEVKEDNPKWENDLISVHREINKIRPTITNLTFDVNKKRKEELDTQKTISDSLLFIMKHMKKWFWSILILFGVFCFILGGITNENKKDIYPVLGKAWDLVDGLRQIKNVKSAVDITD